MLSINISELIWTIINFFLLLFLLRRFLYKPICEHMDARQARVDAGLEQERAAKAALRAEDDRLEEEKRLAREQARALLQETERSAQDESGETLLQAKKAARDKEERRREQMREQNRQEGDLLAAAKPALAAELAGLLVREEDEDP